MTAVAQLDPQLDPVLVAELGAWLRRQRWFPMKGADTSLRAVGGIDLSTSPRVRLLLVAVESAEARAVLQVPLLLQRTDVPPAAAIAWFDGLAVLDAPHTPQFVTAWLDAAQGPVTDPGLRGRIDPTACRVLTGEQSNTSVILSGPQGPVAMLKVLRSLTPGDNPDVDVPRRLVEVGWDAVPEPLGWLRADWPGAPEPGYLAAMAAFVPGAVDGFELACDHARRAASFADLAADLGTVVAGMHRALVAAFGMQDDGADGPARLAANLRERFVWAQATVPTLADRARSVAGWATALQNLPSTPPRQRVHGDLHLGQVLRSGARWFVTDFEGEPLAPVQVRTRPDLALRDVAGVVRSFDYAAAVGGLTGDAADVWVTACRTSFVHAYHREAGGPADPAGRLRQQWQLDEVLVALELDKVLYEVVYEARNRPDWLAIPMRALDRLLPG